MALPGGGRRATLTPTLTLTPTPTLTQVTDFKDARCRQFEESTCSRGGYCNFMHLKKVALA